MRKIETPVNAKKGLFCVVFSRTGIILLLLLLQFGFMIESFRYLEEYLPYIYGALMILEAMVVIHVINTKGNPAFKMTWMLCVLVFPLIGATFYAMVQLQIGTRFLHDRLSMLRIETEPYMRQDQEIVENLWASKSANAHLSYYLSRQLGFPTYRNTEVQYFPLGEDKFKAMLLELKKARKFIFMEYFIVEKGYMWGSILEILKEKAMEGVEVRFMYDGMCAISMLPYNYPRQLEKWGIECKMSNPIKPFLSTTQNNRDHRKICVIDGKVAFTGGVNLGDEYINKKVRFGHWKDTAVMLKGDAVQSFTMIFLQMWNVEVRKPERYKKYLTTRWNGLRRGLGYVIPYADSPFDNENVGEEVYFHILNHAKKYVHIMTPYLILDNEMIVTLTRVAKSGIEVKIIMPHIPDKWYAFAVAKTYYKELIESGVQIYEYTPGFVHAKVFVSDDREAVVGTINLDYRSLYHHFECATYMYGTGCIPRIEEDFQATVEKCRRITSETVKAEKLTVKLTGILMKVAAPLL